MTNQPMIPTRPVIGSRVTALGGEDLGTVIDVVIRKASAHLEFLVIELPPTNEEFHAGRVLLVPWHVVNPDGDHDTLTLGLSKERLLEAPYFERASYPSHFGSEWERDVYLYYGYPSHWERVPQPLTSSVPPPAVGRPSRAGRVGLAAIFVLLLAIAVYAVSRQGWATTSGQVRNAAGAVRDSSTDAATTAKVTAALALSKRVEAARIDVHTTDGIVTLTGKVPSVEVGDVAEAIARDTSGVSVVQNALVLDRSLGTTTVR